MNTNQEQELVQAAVGEERFINIIFADQSENHVGTILFVRHTKWLITDK